ncbi:MAG TPA: bifunctional hydroxymethylpyrimidine kinase/phosphomethylpyrimidine kinase [Verrucomicrobiota bacterium]|nr:bifunctional hydroxymethylpyrimidine kinase/phosphomethylpyrimidine kinase [Verrucomicrobiales bacterium]HRI16529.1 bifunctional hydroxymethylpyrimidine kinase/phosphomethylpyrimidine kinase [Verrucomicrobiota bacterium]
MRHSVQPVALTIAGSDSGGGAGIQADLKTLAALGVFGTSAITCVTAQNPRGVFALRAVQPALVAGQMEAVFSELRPQAVKTGMLFNRAIIAAVVDAWPTRNAPPLVVDPVMVATSGARLLQADAIRVMKRDLLPLATLITPNVDEAVVLLGRPVRQFADLILAAAELHRRFGCAVLLKGGHLRGEAEARDVFIKGSTQLIFSAPFVRGVDTHGTGCTYAAAITAFLARGIPLTQAVEQAKQHVTQAIAGSVRVGRHTALNPFWSPRTLARRRTGR